MLILTVLENGIFYTMDMDPAVAAAIVHEISPSFIIMEMNYRQMACMDLNL